MFAVLLFSIFITKTFALDDQPDNDAYPEEGAYHEDDATTPSKGVQATKTTTQITYPPQESITVDGKKVMTLDSKDANQQNPEAPVNLNPDQLKELHKFVEKKEYEAKEHLQKEEGDNNPPEDEVDDHISSKEMDY